MSLQYWIARVDCWYEHPKTLKRGKIQRKFLIASENGPLWDCKQEAEHAAKRGLSLTEKRRWIGVEFKSAGTVQLPYEIKDAKP